MFFLQRYNIFYQYIIWKKPTVLIHLIYHYVFRTILPLYCMASLCLFCTWTSLNEMYSNANMGTLSFRVREAVQHFKVLRDGVGKYYLWVDKYNSVNDLIEFHKTSSVVRGQNIKLVDLGKVKIYVHIILSFLSQNVHAFFFQVSRKYPAF